MTTNYLLLTYDDPKDGNYDQMRDDLKKLAGNRFYQLGPKTTFLFVVDGVDSKDINMKVIVHIQRHMDPKEGCYTLVNLGEADKATNEVFDSSKGKTVKSIHSPGNPFTDWPGYPFIQSLT